MSELSRNLRAKYVTRTMGRLLWDKLRGTYFTPQEQAGFTTGQSCMDNIFDLHELIEKVPGRKQ